MRLCGGILAALVLVNCGVMDGQAFPAELEFEVAWIKPAVANPNGIHMGMGAGLHNGRFTAVDQTLRNLIAAAFGLATKRIFGPDWLDKEEFDIVAKAPEGIADNEMMPMLQSLLKERFQMAYHVESREMAVYELVVARGGVKMPSYPGPDPKRNPAYDRFSPFMGMTGATLPQISRWLSIFADRPVIDETGLTGRYSLKLQFSRPQTDRNVPDNAPPDLFVALQEQLGLKLHPAKAALDVVIVDQMAQMPSEN